MSQPTQVVTWDSNATHTTPTTAGQQTDGFGTSEVPTSDGMNYWMMSVGLWINYLKGLLTRTIILAPATLAGDAAAVVANGNAVDHPYPINLKVGTKITAVRARTKGSSLAWQTTQAYKVGQVVFNDTPHRKYVCTVAGTSAGSGGPTGTGSGIVDGSVTWNFLGVEFAAGTGTYTVALETNTDGTVAVVATSARSTDNSSGEYIAASGLTTVMATGVSYYAVVHDTGVSSGSINTVEIDVIDP